MAFVLTLLVAVATHTQRLEMSRTPAQSLRTDDASSDGSSAASEGPGDEQEVVRKPATGCSRRARGIRCSKVRCCHLGGSSATL